MELDEAIGLLERRLGSYRRRQFDGVGPAEQDPARYKLEVAIDTVLSELARLKEVERQFEAVTKLERERRESAAKAFGPGVVPTGVKGVMRG